MAEQLSTTRISDLPENISIQSINTREPPSNEASVQYTQMNVHPNPYGMPNQGAVMPPPQHTVGRQPQNEPQNAMVQQAQYNAYLPPASVQNEPHVRLPSRDIPMETSSYMQDEEIQPNYIPKPKLNADYLRDYEDTADVDLKTHKQKKHRESMIDTLLTEFQAPIFVAVLFFIFQMPVVNSLLYKRLSFLPIYNMDGNINFNGLILKSAIFGAFYYSMKNIIDYISSIAL